MRVLSSSLLVALLLPACAQSSSTASRYQLQFDAHDDRGDAIKGLVVSVGETRIGETDKNGILQAEVKAAKGDRYALHITCPKDYASSEMPEHILFRDTKGLAGKEHARIHVQVECARQERVAALLVHTDGRIGMPILVDGALQGRTGPGGFAHLRLDLRPGTQFEVAIDSSQYPELRPANPRRTMSLGTEDELFVFEPAFTETEVKKKKRRRRPKTSETQAPAIKRPVRID